MKTGKQYYYETKAKTISVLQTVIELIENEQYDKLVEMIAGSHDGDGWGNEDYYIKFGKMSNIGNMIAELVIFKPEKPKKWNDIKFPLFDNAEFQAVDLLEHYKDIMTYRGIFDIHHGDKFFLKDCNEYQPFKYTAIEDKVLKMKTDSYTIKMQYNNHIVDVPLYDIEFSEDYLKTVLIP